MMFEHDAMAEVNYEMVFEYDAMTEVNREMIFGNREMVFESCEMKFVNREIAETNENPEIQLEDKPYFDYNNRRFGYIRFFVSVVLCRNKNEEI